MIGQSSTHAVWYRTIFVCAIFLTYRMISVSHCFCVHSSDCHAFILCIAVIIGLNLFFVSFIAIASLQCQYEFAVLIIIICVCVWVISHWIVRIIDSQILVFVRIVEIYCDCHSQYSHSNPTPMNDYSEYFPHFHCPRQRVSLSLSLISMVMTCLMGVIALVNAVFVTPFAELVILFKVSSMAHSSLSSSSSIIVTSNQCLRTH